MKKKKSSSLGRRIIAGLKEIKEALESGQPLDGKFIAHSYELAPPSTHDARSVKLIRKQLGMSQLVFSQLAGVSKVLVQSWEQGQRKPSPLACRLLDDIKADPNRWTAKIRKRELVA